MGEPLLSGIVQVITTSSGDHVVTGAEGCAGTDAVSTLIVLLNSLYPRAFRASTLN